jgi:dipeptidyl aminopeptidase/acylaminoacyl peptidase
MEAPVARSHADHHRPYQPSLRDMVMLEAPMAVKVSPEGRRVAFGVCTTNWKENRYETICHVHDLASGVAYPLNRTGSALQMEWLDDQTLGMLRKEGGDDDKAQVWLYEGLMGDGWAVTDHKTGVEWFKPFAAGLLYRARNPDRDEKKDRKALFGKYIHFEQEDSASSLYYVDLGELRLYRTRLKAATEDEAEKLAAPVIELSRLLPEHAAIREVIPSPTGDAVYVTTQRRDDLVFFRDTRAYAIRLDPRTAIAEHIRRTEAKATEEAGTGDEEEDLSYLGQVTSLHLPRAACVADVAPDGRQLAILYQGRDDRMYTQADLWLIDTQAALEAVDPAAFLEAMRNITAALDQDLLEFHWTESGLYAAHPEGTRVQLVRLAEDGRYTRLDLGDLFPIPIWGCFDVSAGGRIAFVGASATTVPEVCVAERAGKGDPLQVTLLTRFARAVEGWRLGSVETIRWTSRDGTEIEGVLRKPDDLHPTRKYPLVFVVHGGPRWFSPETILGGEERGYYPSVQFVNKGVLVLEPNYRGSMGRGQAFTDLNVDNLGIGDLWDLESAIDHLAALGCVDTERVGCMGWSQGGYISAFAALHSTAFRAVSVGAGVSDWYTYHISNDIPDFTVDYLSGSPFRDRERYLQTAPISQLASARTPMLIQHGSEDRRVPLSNAMELYRGLKEMGVPVELFIFPGMSHPITKPRENHAVMHQNLAWFSHYLLGEDLELE